MSGVKTFYKRYWENQHIKVNSFDVHPGEWTKEDFEYHIKFFKPFIKGYLLDFGCGEGQFLNMISKYTQNAKGIDIAQNVLDKAKKNYPMLEFKLLSDDGKIPYPDCSFDTISAIDVLEHILDIETVLEEYNRVLKPGGCVLIATSEITRSKLFLIMIKAFHQYFYPTSPHIRYFTKRNLAHVLKRKGFKVIKYQKNRTYFGFIPQGQMVIASKIDRNGF